MTYRRIMITAFAILLLGAGCAQRPSVSTSDSSPSGSAVQKVGASAGTVLAGTISQVLDFRKADYEAALQTNKLIVLYFYAKWCPECREEVPHLYDAFSELNNPNVIAFRVNFNDADTDDDERALAREHGVAYQHTKVFVQNRARILKSPTTWNKAEYLKRINAALKQ